MTTTTTDGLEENAVGGSAFGDEGAVGVEVDIGGRTAVTAVAAHGKGGGEVAARSGVVHRAAGTTTTTDGLEEDGVGVVANGLDLEISDLPGAAEGDRPG